MVKINIIIDLIFIFLILLLVFILVIPLRIIPSLPVYYLLFILFYTIILILYMILITNSLLCYYIFLVIAGGIIVTFLFFITFSCDDNILINMLYFFMLIFILLIIFSFTLYIYGFNNLLLMSVKVNTFHTLDKCYLPGVGVFLTMICIRYLLFVIFITVKISTYLRSSPIRNMYEKNFK